MVVAKGEQGDMGVEELIGIPVAHDDADFAGEQVTGVLGVVPDRGAALFHVRLVQREGEELHLERRPGLKGSDEMLVGVAGEGTAVVPIDREALCGHS